VRFEYAIPTIKLFQTYAWNLAATKNCSELYWHVRINESMSIKVNEWVRTISQKRVRRLESSIVRYWGEKELPRPLCKWESSLLWSQGPTSKPYHDPNKCSAPQSYLCSFLCGYLSNYFSYSWFSSKYLYVIFVSFLPSTCSTNLTLLYTNTCAT